MIYECPNCQMPQEAGQTVCPHCHAQFDGPVPDDAIVPNDAIVPQGAAVPPLEAVAAPAAHAAAYTEEVPLPEATMAPGAAGLSAEPVSAAADVEPSPAAGSTQPYLTPPSYVPPAYAPSSYPPPAYTTPAAPGRSPLGGLSRGLLIAFPIVLVLVFGGVYYANTLNSGTDTVPVPPPTVHSLAPATSGPAPVGSPTYLQGGSNINNAADDPRVRMLAGRWETRSGDYYVFSGDGTGSRGNLVKQKKEQSFLWGLVQNRLMLYMDTNETLRFNAGPDNDTIFLGTQTGRYVQFSRAKT